MTASTPGIPDPEQPTTDHPSSAPEPAAPEARTPAVPEQTDAVVPEQTDAVVPEQTDPNAPKATERPHPLTPLVRGWVLLVAGVLAFGQDFLPIGPQRSPGPQVPWWGILVVIAGVAVLAGLASIFTWWFTRFVIDDEEVRIETGMIQRSSKRIGFSRIQSVDVIQPLVARLFGLGELRIEAGGGDGGVTLRYLRRDKAYRLRDYLLSRAHGHQTTVAESDARAQASAFEDLSTADRVLVRISPRQLVIGLLTSLEFLISILVLILVIVAIWRVGLGAFSLTALFPYAISVVSLVSRRVISQYNYTMAETGGVRAGEPTGLRITRGLTNLTSQSVPLDRIQAVRIRQSWLWRKLRLHRVDIDVLGYGTTSNDNNKSSSSMLFPVATTAQVRLAMAYLLPDARDELIDLEPVDRRARFLRPISFRTLRWGANDRAIVSEGGVLVFTRDTVPHAKTQSVRISQGPLQRRLGIASVHVDTTPGPVDFTIPHLSTTKARAIFEAQLPAAADARRRGLTGSR